MSDYPSKVYLNENIEDGQLAKISVFDRGFIFGDGIYEVMVQINGRFFYEEAHIKRLKEGLDKVQIKFDVEALRSEIPQLLKASDLSDSDCMLYIQITRGVAPRKHSFPEGIKPTVFMYAIPKLLPDINQENVSVVTQPETRWSRCDIKMTSLIGNILANQHAMNQDAYETIFVRDGVITEASHCNVFFAKNNVIYTHPANEFILNGITRIIIIELCAKLGIKLVESGITHAEMATMDEAFLTGTSTQIASIRQIDDHKFYDNNNTGTITKRLQEAYAELKLI